MCHDLYLRLGCLLHWSLGVSLFLRHPSLSRELQNLFVLMCIVQKNVDKRGEVVAENTERRIYDHLVQVLREVTEVDAFLDFVPRVALIVWR